MHQAFQAVSAAVLAGAFALTGQAAAETDTFVTEAILENLADAKSADEFENRLRREAKRYCKREAPYASRRDLSACQQDIVTAVAQQLEDQNVVVAWGN